MSGSFYDYLPKKRSTRIFLLIGLCSCFGFCILGLLLHLRTAEQQHVAASIDHSETPLQKPADPLIPSAQPQTGDTRVSVNTASQMELEELPYIGTKKASQIIERRPYRTIEEFFSKNTFSEKQVVELRNVLNL